MQQLKNKVSERLGEGIAIRPDFYDFQLNKFLVMMIHSCVEAYFLFFEKWMKSDILKWDFFGRATALFDSLKYSKRHLF